MTVCREEDKYLHPEWAPRVDKSNARGESGWDELDEFEGLDYRELGCVERDRHGAGFLFQVLTEGEENSVAIVSNESFGGWTKAFTDPCLCAAIVQRLAFNGTIVETGTDSCRLASTRARAEEPAEAG